MNNPTTLEMITKVRLNDSAPDVGAWLRRIARSVAKARTTGGIRSASPSSRTISGYRLGDAVLHGSFGAGQVMAHWPDGTLVVRFDGETKSRLIWPSLLDRVNSRRR